jgi:hypothetical protein
MISKEDYIAYSIMGFVFDALAAGFCFDIKMFGLCAAFLCINATIALIWMLYYLGPHFFISPEPAMADPKTIRDGMQKCFDRATKVYNDGLKAKGLA